MSLRCEDYKAAYEAARLMANATRCDVAIRRVKEFGRNGYNVGLASRNDSDYARAEIVRPGAPRCEPVMTNKICGCCGRDLDDCACTVDDYMTARDERALLEWKEERDE